MQCFRSEAPEETSHFDEERAKAAFFGAVSGKLGEDGSRRLAQALADAVEERPSAGNAGEDGNPLHLLSAKRRWAIRDGDLPLAESIAAAVAQTLEALEGSPSSLFSAAATIFLLARHVRSRGCRCVSQDKFLGIHSFFLSGFTFSGKCAESVLSFRFSHHEVFLEPSALAAELHKAAMVHDPVDRRRGEVRIS
jgi:hypothetical protein